MNEYVTKEALKADTWNAVRMLIPTTIGPELLILVYQATKHQLRVLNSSPPSYQAIMRIRAAKTREKQIEWRLSIFHLFEDHDGVFRLPERSDRVQERIKAMAHPDTHLTF